MQPASLWAPVVQQHANSGDQFVGTVRGCDVSNFTSVHDSVVIRGPALVQAVREMAGIQFVIVQGLPPSYSSTDPQCQAVIDGGSWLGGYCYLFHGCAGAEYQARLARFEPYYDHIWRMACDLEEVDLTEDECHLALAQTKSFKPSKPLVCYTGPWWLERMGWKQSTFPEVEEWWLSIYDGIPDPKVGAPAGYRVDIKQYADHPNTDLITGVDMNAMDASLLYV